MIGRNVSLLSIALLLAGCTAADDKGTETGTETGDDTSDDTSAETDLCAGQEASTTTVSETQVDAAYPTPAGGTIADGTYDLVRFDVYSPAVADGHVRARRFVISGDTIVAINVDDGAAQPIIAGTWSAAGTDLSISLTCPSAGSVTLPYTATADELWLLDPSEPNAQIYARQ